jgi:hypothetical protein
MNKEDWHHVCDLSDEMCEIWHGWERIMDYVVAVELPKAMARPIDADVLTGWVSSGGRQDDLDA